MKRWVVKPGSRVDLSSVDPGSAPGAPGDRDTTEQAAASLAMELGALQTRLWAESRRSLLVVLQGTDASGKDGTIRHVFTGVNPLGVHVTSFKAPAPDELAHDFLWRIHRATPARGQIGIFNRSHYEDVVAVRVRKLVPKSVWEPRFDSIAGFERMLTGEGTRIVKLFLHISKREQAARLRARLEEPDKRWKFNAGDLEDRKRWKSFQTAYSEAIERTSARDAPWFVIPADKKWYRNWAVTRILVDTLAEMDPRYPEPEGLDGIEIK